MPPKKRRNVVTPAAPTEPEIIMEEEYVPQENVVVEEPKKTNPYLSVYEYTALIHARTLQLSSPEGVPMMDLAILPESQRYDPLIIATYEVRQYLPRFVVRRKLPNGDVEDWFLTDKELRFPRV